jgi:hypothetical protein
MRSLLRAWLAPPSQAAASPQPIGLRTFLSGYDRRSVVALVVLVGSGLVVGARPQDLFGVAGQLDWLLGVMWLWLAIVLPWRIHPARDLAILAFGAAGGALIESWGTWTGVWWYATAERPPWWVVPAWATTALAGERTCQILMTMLRRARIEPAARSRASSALYGAVLGAFAVAMTGFSLRAASGPAVAVAGVTMVVVIGTTRLPLQDLGAFVAGSLLGVFIEPWGTRAGVWTYYTLQTPPVVAVFAHGFATLAFLRAAEIGARALVHVRGAREVRRC